MRRETDTIATGDQFQRHQKQDIDGAGMKAHLEFFQDHPLDLPAPGDYRGRHEPVEPEQRGTNSRWPADQTMKGSD